MRILGGILAGGKASRFGSDKALARVGDKTLIEHVAESLRHCDEVVILGRGEGELGELDFWCVTDRTLAAGPLNGPVAGLITALEIARVEGFSHVFLTSCDTFGLQEHWPFELGMFEGSVVAIYDGRWQPMCSLWSVASFPVLLETLEKFAHSTKGPSFQRIMEVIGATAVPPFEGWERVVSVNTPADLPV